MSPTPFSLFSVTGLEMEYMIVDRQTLDVSPICDELLRMVSGEITADYENDDIAWSNELVLHVVELKTNGPASSLDNIADRFHQNVSRINELLSEHGAVLMPTGAHPWMDPLKETRIWPHEHNEIYSLYNRIFDCRGHGWSNLQSMHINLPFNGDREFMLLHSAIRMLMPILPALTASTPLLDGTPTGFLDSRMEMYRHNQKKIPSIGGRVIPEYVESEAHYHELVFNPITRDIRPYDHEKILDKHFLNSRGAIARFDRGAIEIRILDLQESPAMDTAVAVFIREALQWLINERQEWLTSERLTTERLAEIFVEVIRGAEHADITDTTFLEAWGAHKPIKGGELLQKLFEVLADRLPETSAKHIAWILEHGSLASRILERCGTAPSAQRLKSVYAELVETLMANGFYGR